MSINILVSVQYQNINRNVCFIIKYLDFRRISTMSTSEIGFKLVRRIENKYPFRRLLPLICVVGEALDRHISYDTGWFSEKTSGSA